MKREGRQHGMVITYNVSPPPWDEDNPATNHRMLIGKIDDPPTAGMFSKVSSKPTNHSKFTSRCSRRPGCRGCHEHPVCKSKLKAKGTHKMRHESRVSWRVVDSLHGFRYLGSSGSGFLKDLDDFGRDYLDEDEDEDENEDEDGIGDENELMVDPVIGSGDVKDDDDDDENSFFDVGAVWEHVYEDEGWCLVG